MRVIDVVNEAKAAMRASEVFGTPYEKNGITIIPAAKIAGGAGGGGDQAQPQAGGVGFGVSSRPVGAFVIKGDEVSWQPALDLNRIILMGQVVAIVALLTARAIVKVAAKRR
ncbi:MAG: sporulation protein [Chloroflexi bacterium]|nr:MAG: sporulation protein [Chloroflexota bacterium]